MPVRNLLVVASLLGGLFFATADASSEAPRRLNFDVFLDERPIGFQHFDLQPTRDGVRVVTQAEFQVKVLRITAFEYDHRNEELWSGRCLQAIESTTNSNGTPYRVSGRAGEAGFVLGVGGPGRRIDDCVGTFAYWDRSQLAGRDRLLNSQTGEYVQVEVRPLGAGSLALDGRDVRVERFALSGRDIDITLAYAADSGEWLALDSRLESGRMLRYRRAD
ncbi:MAG: hypothetical protein QG550_532 [Pseudomonadota bacterium]|jgi:hypothetical protein|nr:hypothetical protein [Pseudomonadota bacterium]